MARKTLLILLFLSALSVSTYAERAVTSAHRMATDAAMEVLNDGGNAADAAFTAAAVLTIVEPWFSSVMGGGTWALYYKADTGRVHSMDGVGPAASGATSEYFSRSGVPARSGMHQAVVPGAWAGWMEWLKEFGSLPLDRLLQPVIDIAESGYPVYPTMAEWLRRGEDNISAWPYSREIYMPEGDLLGEGDTVRQPAMARTFRDIQRVFRRNIRRGRSDAFDAANDYYYRGPIAESIVDYSREHDGLFELSDFTEFRTGIVEPISIEYRDITVYQNPPNSQGVTMLMALNILEGYDFGGYEVNEPEAVHLQVEAIKIAHAAKHRHVGDPEYTDVPVEELISDEHAGEARELIRPDRALTWSFPDTLDEIERSNTTTFHILDDDGNGAAVTTSLGAQFLVAGPSGVHINNRMRMFYYGEGYPNTVEPGKKVRHTSNPFIALQDGDLYILGGNTGVDTQPQGQVQQFISVVEFGLTPQEAVSRPRYISRGFPAGQWPFRAENDLALEPGTPAALRRGLEELGHVTINSGIWGSAHMIVVDLRTGALSVGTDPRDPEGKGVVE